MFDAPGVHVRIYLECIINNNVLLERECDGKN